MHGKVLVPRGGVLLKRIVLCMSLCFKPWKPFLRTKLLFQRLVVFFKNIFTFYVCRLNTAIKLLLASFMIIAMAKVLQLTHSSQYRVMPCKYSCTLMSWRFVIPWDLRSKFINWVCVFLFIIYTIYLFNYLGSFYFTLGNLSPKYRSKLSNIYLLALVKSTFISTYGMDAVLQPFIDMILKTQCLLVRQPDVAYFYYWSGISRIVKLFLV